MSTLKFQSALGEIEIINEPGYAFGSADNVRLYRLEQNFGSPHRPVSAHGVILDGEPLALFGGAGGATGIHKHSAELVGDNLFIAVGDSVLCLGIQPLTCKWRTKVDDATCFGVYSRGDFPALFCHGELQICRLSFGGEIEWETGGRDIFTGEFRMLPESIEVTDFEGRIYHLDYLTGKLSGKRP